MRAALERRTPGRYVVEFGAKHTDPLIEEAAAKLASAGLERVVGLVLTPHASSMGSQEYLDRAAAALGPTPLRRRRPWYGEPGFVELLAARVAAALARAAGPQHASSSPRTRFPSASGEAGDTYPEQVAESARLVAGPPGCDEWEVAWQSAGRTPEPWLGPDVRDEVRRLAAEGGTDAVVVCPIGFVADHLEVLYDLDVELAAVAADVGLAYARTASLNDDPAFVAVLADADHGRDGGA